MGWSYRKSFGSGPFRINFSKRGISYSVGVKGARINMGPRGTYVNLSSHGISYRQKISNAAVPVHHQDTPALPAIYDDGHQIASAAIEQLTDSDSKAFIAELTQKATQISYVKWFGVYPLIAFLCILLFTSFGSRSIIIHPATDSILVRVTSPIGVYIRHGAGPRSGVIKSAIDGQTFQLLDSTDHKWLKVGFHDSAGYISRRFAMVDHVHHDQESSEELYVSNVLAPYLLVAGLGIFTFWIIYLKKLDKKRFQMELHYEMDEKFQQVYQQFADHFTTFARSARIWQHLNAFQTNDFKRNGGAGKLVRRATVRGISVNQPPLPHFITNVSIPSIRLMSIEFYFLPERLVVKRGNSFGAVFYKNLYISGLVTRFIEDESVPGDARVVDHTWRYVNKHGGPDRRFNDNRQIPVCAYSEYTLRSDTGVYEVLMTSKEGAMDGFANFLAQIGSLQSQMAFSE